MSTPSPVQHTKPCTFGKKMKMYRLSIYICHFEVFLRSSIHPHTLIQPKAPSGHVIRCGVKWNESSVGGERLLVFPCLSPERTHTHAHTHLVTHMRTLVSGKQHKDKMLRRPGIKCAWERDAQTSGDKAITEKHERAGADLRVRFNQERRRRCHRGRRLTRSSWASSN